MSEIKRIIDQMQRAFAGEAWHGPAVQEVLARVSAQQAAARPFANVHSIWEIVLHMAVWKRIVRRRVLGEAVVEVPPEEDWPAVANTGHEAWMAAQKDLKQAQEDLIAVVAQCREARLDEPVPGQRNSLYVTVHGVIQHDLYHAGQIAILHRAQT